MQLLSKKIKNGREEQLRVGNVRKYFRRLHQRIGFKGSLHLPLDAVIKLKVRFRTGDADLEECGERFWKLDEDNDVKFKYDCGSACEEQIHMVGECFPHGKDREIYRSKLEIIEGCDTEAP